jgi:hypothetical protein
MNTKFCVHVATSHVVISTLVVSCSADVYLVGLCDFGSTECQT